MIISPLERRTARGRLALGAIYLLLTLGGLTMIYPFLLMTRLSTADATDRKSLAFLPRFWWDRDELARKFLLFQYTNPVANANPEAPAGGYHAGPEWDAGGFVRQRDFWRTNYGDFERIPEAAQRQQIADYQAFLAGLDPRFFHVFPRSVDPRFESFTGFLARTEGKPERSLLLRVFSGPDLGRRDWRPGFDQEWRDSLAYLRAQPASVRGVYGVNWAGFLRERYGAFTIHRLNAAHGTAYRTYGDAHFPADTPPENQPRLRADYLDFVANRFPHFWTTVERPEEFQPAWTDFLRDERKIASPADWQTLTGLETPDIALVPFTASMPENEAWAALWSGFLHRHVPPERRTLTTPDRLYVRFLQSRYPDLPALDRAWGTRHAAWDDVKPEPALVDYRQLLDHPWRIAWTLTASPYATVLRKIVYENRALLNTGILIALSLVASLTVNPLAAYALSRFRLRGTHKILLFILATMALPAEIAMVPNFLLIKELGLMNNFLALVLPGAANAFGIFLLKGFFDSLPAELYEAAVLDGASEFVIFTRITIPLSQPILAVTAMGAVLGAYGSFIPAVLYLQDREMWPLMTKLYELTANTQTYPYAVGMAALVVSSIPTFLVFLFCQRLIMRGIILPSMK